VERLGTYDVNNRAVKWLSVSDTNELLIVATGDGKIHIFRVETGEKLASRDISPMYLRQVEFSMGSKEFFFVIGKAGRGSSS